MNRIKLICVSVALLATLMLSFGCTKEQENSYPSTLVLSDKTSGEEYASYEISPGDTFTVTFIHSVNKSPVTDVYEIREDGIWLTENIYYGFGAGVPAELKNDEYLETGDDNSMVIKNMETKMDTLIYVVGTVSDHTLEINGEEISLRDLCGKNSHVLFSLK